MANLLQRLNKIERNAAPQSSAPFLARIVADDWEEAEAERQLAEEGFDIARDSIAIIRLVAPPHVEKC
ncbi:hypothetical protein [Mesorhizobium sp. ANAO-SY3R2]|uniref:hypothetical protein n=1 Tax=Mesorhizobium sp. ANAO-SY3R2 TaxID=3166644 RepID=UPI0036729921